MAVTVTFNFSDGQQARITQARDAHNAAHETSLTSKQYLLLIIKAEVGRSLVRQLQTEVIGAIHAEEAAAEASLATDLIGNA